MTDSLILRVDAAKFKAHALTICKKNLGGKSECKCCGTCPIKRQVMQVIKEATCG